MIQNFKNFLEEAIKIPKSWYEVPVVETLTPDQIKKLQEKTGLRTGDPVLFTGTVRVYSIHVNSSGELKYAAIKGSELNDENLKFIRWMSSSDLKKIGSIPTSKGYYQYLLFSIESTDTPQDVDNKIDSLLIAECKNSKGESYYLSMFTFNPRYKPKEVDVFKDETLEAVAEWVGKQLELETEVVSLTEGDWVVFKTWFVFTVPISGDVSKVAGPFKNEAEAEKVMKDIEKSAPIKGTLDQQLLNKMRFRVDAKNPIREFKVNYMTTKIPSKEFTSAVKEVYGKDVTSKLKSRIAVKKFGI